MVDTVATMLRSFACMSHDEKQVSLTIVLYLLSVADSNLRKRGKDIRQRFAYYLQPLGEVCGGSGLLFTLSSKSPRRC